jgi:hypothetical protein
MSPVSPIHCPHSADVDDHFAGRLSPRAEQKMRDHAAGCAGCRTRYRRHLRLEKLDPRALGREERLARALGLSRRARPRPWALAGLMGALALGGVLVLPAIGSLRADRSDGLRARGGPPGAAPVRLILDPRGTEVAAFRTSGPGAPAPALPRMGRGDELAFAYRNGDAWPWLMIFGQDEAGAIYWFSPQWTDPAADPAAVSLESTPGQHELPAAVAHDLRGPSLSLCALVSRAPLSIRAVEASLATRQPPAEALAGPGRAVTCQRLELAP